MHTKAENSDELFRILVESSTDFAIFTQDTDGVVNSWNIGAERLLGYAEGEIVGRNCRVIFTPEDRAAGIPEQEMAAARERGKAEDERWHLRADGARFWGSGLLMPLVGGTGYVKILRDQTVRHRQDEAIRDSENRFRALATNIPQLVFRCRSNGVRTWGSPQWEVFTGLSNAASQGFGWLDAIHPDDRDLTVEAWGTAQATGLYEVEHRTLRVSDGQYRWHQTRARPSSENDGDWVGTSSDIHDLRTLQGRQGLLLAELQHRTRNLLNIVGSIARSTARNSPSLETFVDEFEGRLRALSRVQGLLVRSDHNPVPLSDIVQTELAAHGDLSDQAQAGGPDIAIPAKAAQTLSMAIHELATNAAKYGALGRSTGRLAINWRLERDDDRDRVVLEWRETGVPIAATPTRQGFGTELIERALPYQLEARTELAYEPDGVRCTISVPLQEG